MHDGYGVFLGLDVGKDDHHAVALDPDGKRLHDAALPNDEARLRAAVRQARPLTAECWSWSTSPPRSAPCRSRSPGRAGIKWPTCPGLAMRRIADLHPGTAKTDARDAYVIADAARTLPHTLRARRHSATRRLAELEVIVGFDDDLAGEVTRDQQPDPWPAHPDPPRPGTRPRPGCITRPCWSCCHAAAAPVGLARPASRKLLDRCSRTRTRHGRPARRGRSSPRSPRRPSSSPAPTPPERSCPGWPTPSRAAAPTHHVAGEVERMLDAHPLAPVLT